MPEHERPYRKIAMAGAPMVGKTTFLQSLERRNPQSQRTVDADETKRIIHVDIPLSWRHLCIAIAFGAFVNDTVIPTVLTGATVVVYVISAFAAAGEQRGFFDEYVTCATQVGAHWDQVPWLFVLNKLDLVDQNPILDSIPARFHDSIIRCVAVTDHGVDALWQQILDTVASRS